MDSAWFLNNVGRYDKYPRSTRVFVGEYACHEPTQPNGRRPNNLYSALCEAAYMTGLERNSDVVAMASYAPLLAREGMQQWTPDLIWYNAREVLLTPNYYVQQMFASTVGDQVVASEMDSRNKLIYHVVTRTDDRLYVKLVNVSAYADEMIVSLANVPDGMGTVTCLTGGKNDINTFQNKERVAPRQDKVTLENGTLTIELPAYSVAILTLKLK